MGLEGSLWLLASVGDGPTAVRRVAGTSPTLQFLDDGRFHADTGCNTLNGTYSADGADGLRLACGPMTLRACLDEGAQRQEAAIVAGLTATRRPVADDEHLALLDDAGSTLLTYLALPTDVAGTSWTITGVNTGTAVESSALTERLTLVLGTDGTASGDAGCNTFHARYTAEADRLAFDAIATTRMACEPDVMAMERSYLTALGRVTRSRRHGPALVLVDDSDTTLVTLSPNDP